MRFDDSFGDGRPDSGPLDPFFADPDDPADATEPTDPLVAVEPLDPVDVVDPVDCPALDATVEGLCEASAGS